METGLKYWQPGSINPTLNHCVMLEWVIMMEFWKVRRGEINMARVIRGGLEGLLVLKLTSLGWVGFLVERRGKSLWGREESQCSRSENTELGLKIAFRQLWNVQREFFVNCSRNSWIMMGKVRSSTALNDMSTTRTLPCNVYRVNAAENFFLMLENCKHIQRFWG